MYAYFKSVSKPNSEKDVETRNTSPPTKPCLRKYIGDSIYEAPALKVKKYNLHKQNNKSHSNSSSAEDFHAEGNYKCSSSRKHSGEVTVENKRTTRKYNKRETSPTSSYECLLRNKLEKYARRHEDIRPNYAKEDKYKNKHDVTEDPRRNERRHKMKKYRNFDSDSDSDILHSARRRGVHKLIQTDYAILSKHPRKSKKYQTYDQQSNSSSYESNEAVARSTKMKKHRRYQQNENTSFDEADNTMLHKKAGDDSSSKNFYKHQKSLREESPCKQGVCFYRNEKCPKFKLAKQSRNRSQRKDSNYQIDPNLLENASEENVRHRRNALQHEEKKKYRSKEEEHYNRKMSKKQHQKQYNEYDSSESSNSSASNTDKRKHRKKINKYKNDDRDNGLNSSSNSSIEEPPSPDRKKHKDKKENKKYFKKRYKDPSTSDSSEETSVEYSRRRKEEHIKSKKTRPRESSNKNKNKSFEESRYPEDDQLSNKSSIISVKKDSFEKGGRRNSEKPIKKSISFEKADNSKKKKNVKKKKSIGSSISDMSILGESLSYQMGINSPRSSKDKSRRKEETEEIKVSRKQRNEESFAHVCRPKCRNKNCTKIEDLKSEPNNARKLSDKPLQENEEEIRKMSRSPSIRRKSNKSPEREINNEDYLKNEEKNNSLKYFEETGEFDQEKRRSTQNKTSKNEKEFNEPGKNGTQHSNHVKQKTNENAKCQCRKSRKKKTSLENCATFSDHSVSIKNTKISTNVNEKKISGNCLHKATKNSNLSKSKGPNIFCMDTSKYIDNLVTYETKENEKISNDKKESAHCGDNLEKTNDIISNIKNKIKIIDDIFTNVKMEDITNIFRTNDKNIDDKTPTKNSNENQEDLEDLKETVNEKEPKYYDDEYLNTVIAHNNKIEEEISNLSRKYGQYVDTTPTPQQDVQKTLNKTQKLNDNQVFYNIVSYDNEKEEISNIPEDKVSNKSQRNYKYIDDRKPKKNSSKICQEDPVKAADKIIYYDNKFKEKISNIYRKNVIYNDDKKQMKNLNKIREENLLRTSDNIYYDNKNEEYLSNISRKNDKYIDNKKLMINLKISGNKNKEKIWSAPRKNDKYIDDKKEIKNVNKTSSKKTRTLIYTKDDESIKSITKENLSNISRKYNNNDYKKPIKNSNKTRQENTRKLSNKTARKLNDNEIFYDEGKNRHEYIDNVIMYDNKRRDKVSNNSRLNNKEKDYKKLIKNSNRTCQENAKICSNKKLTKRKLTDEKVIFEGEYIDINLNNSSNNDNKTFFIRNDKKLEQKKNKVPRKSLEKKESKTIKNVFVNENRINEISKIYQNSNESITSETIEKCQTSTCKNVKCSVKTNNNVKNDQSFDSCQETDDSTFRTASLVLNPKCSCKHFDNKRFRGGSSIPEESLAELKFKQMKIKNQIRHLEMEYKKEFESNVKLQSPGQSKEHLNNFSKENNFGCDLKYTVTCSCLDCKVVEDPKIECKRNVIKPKKEVDTNYDKKKFCEGCYLSGVNLRNDVCKRCHKKVYIVERIKAGGSIYHCSCFTCHKCQRRLDSLNLVENGGEVFCKQCHMKSFGPHIYGFNMAPNLN